MRTVLIIGAGRSASSLIQYLLNKSVEEDLHLIIGDLSIESARNKTNNHPNATAISFDIFDQNQNDLPTRIRRNPTLSSTNIHRDLLLGVPVSLLVSPMVSLLFIVTFSSWCPLFLHRDLFVPFFVS